MSSPTLADEWTEVWPTEDGWYWAYGERYGEGKNRILFPVLVKVGSTILYLQGGTAFMFKGETGRMFFKPMTLPDVPGF